MVSSLNAAETIQKEMIENNEQGTITVTKSDKVFKFADGDHDAAANQAEIHSAVSQGVAVSEELML